MKQEILVVSNNISQFGSYRSLLENENFTVSLRATIDEALKFRKRADLVIVDMDLPCFRKGNLKFIKKFIGKGSHVILLVNEITDVSLNECIEQYSIEVIQKPVDYEELVDSINLNLGKTNSKIFL